jgi:hypothetical protein
MVTARLDKVVPCLINDAQDIENDGGFGYPVWQMQSVNLRQILPFPESLGYRKG